MKRDTSSYRTLDKKNDKRITKVKTTKGSLPFKKETVKRYVSEEYWSDFEEFFNSRTILAERINEQLIEQNLVLWKRENIL